MTDPVVDEVPVPEEQAPEEQMPEAPPSLSAQPLPPDPERERVRRLQEALWERGYYDGTIDGIFHYLTQAAVRAFQRDHGLPVTGELDAAQARLLLGDDWDGDTLRVREVIRHG